MNKFWMKRQQWKYPLILFLIFISVIGLSLPKGALYGSTTDWYSQHAALAETIRTACLEQKTLLPKYLDLGGGSNGFLFSYYGYLRPDIVLGCLFPQVPMQYFVMGYMLIGYFVSVLLFYRLLLAEKMPNFQAFLGSALFLLSTCFFQTHRQVMFINYMPFLIAAFLLIKKKKYCWIPLLLSLIYCNSFYYAIAVLASIGWYWYREEGIAFFKHYIKSTLLSIGMTAALLIPTGLVILEHKRSGTGPEGIFAFHWDFASLLYSPYGMGLTAICLYTLFLGLSSKRYRVDSLFYLFLTGSGLAAYVLNGFLYARSKILIPFVPLFLLHCVRIFRELQTKKLTWRFWPFLPLLGVLACYRKSELFLVLIADCLIIFFVLLVNKYFPQRNIALLILLILPACAFLKTADTEKYVSLAQVEDIGVETSFHRNTGLAQVYAKESSPISVKTSKFSLALQNDLYRFDSIYEPLSTGNRDASSNRKKSTMYSSITDESYRQVYYDLLMTPIQINNRIALLAADNPFLLYFMGVRYLETSSEHIPDGYRILKREGNRVIAENENVLPLA
ncbi:MAG: YfhO family protein [Hespellia sp.]|nr:YfhO family protein [Hespellia sp.]